MKIERILLLSLIGVGLIIGCLLWLDFPQKEDHKDKKIIQKEIVQEDEVQWDTVESHSCQAIQKRGVLKVGVKSFSWAWFQEPGKSLKKDPWYGWETEYVKRFAAALDVDIEYVKFYDGFSQFEAVRNGRVDIVMTSGLIETYNADHEYTTSISYNDWGLDDFPVIIKKDSIKDSFEQLKNAKIGVIDDTSVITSSKAYFSDAHIEIVDFYDLIDLLDNHQIDAIVTYDSHYQILSDIYDGYQLSQVSVPVKSQGMGVFLMKGNEDLKGLIDQEIVKINQENLGEIWSSQYYQLAKKWKVNDVE